MAEVIEKLNERIKSSPIWEFSPRTVAGYIKEVLDERMVRDMYRSSEAIDASVQDMFQRHTGVRELGSQTSTGGGINISQNGDGYDIVRVAPYNHEDNLQETTSFSFPMSGEIPEISVTATDDQGYPIPQVEGPVTDPKEQSHKLHVLQVVLATMPAPNRQ